MSRRPRSKTGEDTVPQLRQSLSEKLYFRGSRIPDTKAHRSYMRTKARYESGNNVTKTVSIY